MLTIVVVFSAINGFSQTLAYRDLLGKWENTKGAMVSYHFLDSVNVKMNSAKYGISAAVYHLKNEGQHTLLMIEMDNKGIKRQIEYSVKQFDGKILRLENTDTYDPIIQKKPKETGLWLLRQKS